MSVTAGHLSKDSDLCVITADFIHWFHTRRDRTLLVCPGLRFSPFSSSLEAEADAEPATFAIWRKNLWTGLASVGYCTWKVCFKSIIHSPTGILRSLRIFVSFLSDSSSSQSAMG